MTRQDKKRKARTRQDKTRQDKTRQDKTGEERTREEMTGRDKTRKKRNENENLSQSIHVPFYLFPLLRTAFHRTKMLLKLDKTYSKNESR